jgi:hypothetical protein
MRFNAFLTVESLVGISTQFPSSFEALGWSSTLPVAIRLCPLLATIGNSSYSLIHGALLLFYRGALWARTRVFGVLAAGTTAGIEACYVDPTQRFKGMIGVKNDRLPQGQAIRVS